ncbi:MAG: NADPH-dependent FMN reductase [Candidatus Saccharibacteria bacterium]
MVNIKVILGSTRSHRFGNQPADWIMKLSEAYTDKATFELIDLKDMNLPFFDEPNPPMMGNETQDYAKAWTDAIDSADGFIFVTPEYNHSYPATLKNAIDYLYSEWAHKPAGFVSYGASEGGARAVEHLRPLLSFLNVYDISEHISLHNYYLNLDDKGAYKFDETHEQKVKPMLDKVVFWAEEMKASRAKLAA